MTYIVLRLLVVVKEKPKHLKKKNWKEIKILQAVINVCHEQTENVELTNKCHPIVNESDLESDSVKAINYKCMFKTGKRSLFSFSKTTATAEPCSMWLKLIS